MAPLVLFGTLVTHLFGGSADREGTTIQMGGILAEALGRTLRVSTKDRNMLLIYGISGGFGSILEHRLLELCSVWKCSRLG
ncbi:chloride channel protein [Paenibacillus sp. UNC496MF]|uniref:chloride channel protein n=1 Tax=Paenibacillus sp. UNC496MF TaxID=1502753 RepID=UPI0035276112